MFIWDMANLLVHKIDGKVNRESGSRYYSTMSLEEHIGCSGLTDPPTKPLPSGSITKREDDKVVNTISGGSQSGSTQKWNKWFQFDLDSPKFIIGAVIGLTGLGVIGFMFLLKRRRSPGWFYHSKESHYDF